MEIMEEEALREETLLLDGQVHQDAHQGTARIVTLLHNNGSPWIGLM